MGTIAIIGTVTLIIGVIGYWIYNNFADFKDRLSLAITDDLSSKTDGDESDNNAPTTLCIVCNSLKKMGCQSEMNGENSLSVSYQGETFQFDFGESPSRYTRIWDPWWAQIKNDDPQLELIKEAINAANYNFGPTILMTDADENNVISLHSKYDIMVHPACEDNDQYIKSVLNSFFPLKDAVRSNFQHLSNQRIEQFKNRRTVGFKSTTE